MADSEQRVAPAASTPPESQSVGQILKQARIARDLSIEQMSTELRIEAPQLEALEQDRFERIGVTVFVKGYLRQYGTRLGLDARDLLAQYAKQSSLKDVQIQPSKTIKLRDERQITVWILALFVLAALVVALGVWWWSGGLSGGAVRPATPTSTEPETSPPIVAGAPERAPPAAAPVAATAAQARASVPAAPSLPAPVPAGAPGAAESASAAGAAANDDVPAGGDRPGQAFRAALQVAFVQDSWAEINDAHGARLFYGLGAAGRNEKLEGEPPFNVVLGNSAGVKILIDGEDFPIPTSGRPGDYSRFSVNVAGD